MTYTAMQLTTHASDGGSDDEEQRQWEERAGVHPAEQRRTRVRERIEAAAGGPTRVC